MPNIAECPICDTKYDITSLKDGMKLKCTRCHKVVGTVSGGSLLPILETIKAPALSKKIAPKLIAQEGVGEESVYEEVVVRKRVPRGSVLSRLAPTPQIRREKPPIMLMLAGVAGLTALTSVVYITFMLYQPQEIFKAPAKHMPKTTVTGVVSEK
jgi:hypothetical protein